MTCVRIWGFTTACGGGLLSPFCGALPVTVGALFPLPEVMARGEPTPAFTFTLPAEIEHNSLNQGHANRFLAHSKDPIQ